MLMVKRSYIVLISYMFVSILVLVGCTGPAQPSTSNDSSSTEPGVEAAVADTPTPVPDTPTLVPEPPSEKVLVVAQVGDATTMDANMHNDTPTRNIHLNIFSPLVLRMPDGTVQPALAESWETPDDLTWIFHIRKGVKFHNGNELTAEDAKFTLERIIDEENKSPRASYWRTLDTVEVPDPYTLVIRTTTPYPLVLSRLSGTFDVVSKDYYEEVGPEEASSHPIGTGPFKFVEWVKDERVVLEAFDDYWGDPPKVDKVIFRSIPEASTRIAELLSGNVHLFAGLNIEQAEDLDQQEGVGTIVGNSTRVEFIVLDNVREGPLQDVKVRQALNYAVDKEGLLEAFLGGHGEPVGQIVSRPMFGFNPDVAPYPYDPEQAKELLAEAGYPDGFNIDFDCDQAHKEICEAIALQLGQVGVETNLNVLENTIYSQRVNEKQAAPMFWSSWLGLTVDAEGTLTPRLLTGARVSYFSDPSVDEQIKAGAATVNPKERERVYMPLMVELKEKAPWIFLWQGVDIYGVSDKVTGWTPRPDSYILLGEADLKE